MSTSLNNITIDRFLKNCSVEIEIPYQDLGWKTPCGYCKFEGAMSHYQDEEEVLFNLYNSFRVDNV